MSNTLLYIVAISLPLHHQLLPFSLDPFFLYLDNCFPIFWVTAIFADVVAVWAFRKHAFALLQISWLLFSIIGRWGMMGSTL